MLSTRSGRKPRVALLLISLAMGFTSISAQEPQPRTKRGHKDDKPRQREKWFYEQRTLPDGTSPAALRLQGFERLEEMRATERGKNFLNGRVAPSNDGQSIGTSVSQWVPIGPRPTETGGAVGVVAGRTAAVAVNPLNADEVYVAGAQGGLWRSMNGGLTWTPLTDFESSLAGGAIALDETTCVASPGPPCQTVYFATGEQTFSSGSYYGAGILKTSNAGVSWTPLPGNRVGGGAPFFVGPLSVSTGGARIGSLVIQPGTGGDTAVLLAGTQVFVSADEGASSGIYRSADGGGTWVQVLSGAVGTEVVFDRANPMIAWCALGTTSRASGSATVSDPENGIYKSIDGGMSWVRQTLPSPVTSTNLGRIELSVGPPVAPSTEGVVYASIADATNGSDSLLAVLKTVDGGITWQHLPAGTATAHCNPQCWYDHVIRVHPNNANVVYMGGAAGANYFSRTVDGGTTWSPVQVGSGGNRLHVDIQTMAFGFSGSLATQLFVGNDGGVWRADVSNPTNTGPNPLNWINLNQDLQMMQFYPSPSFPSGTVDIGFGGSQDNGTQKYSGFLQWSEVTCGDGGWTTVDPNNSNNVYVTCQNIDIRRSLNGGNTFTSIDNPASNPITQTDRVAFIPPLVLDAGNPSRLYFGTFRVWQTTNAAAATPSWLAVSPDLTSGSGTLRALAIAPSNSEVLYAGSSDGRIQRTTNVSTILGNGTSGAAWTNITGSGLPSSRNVTWLAVHPTNQDIVFASFGGFSRPPGGSSSLFPDTLGHVFRVTLSGGQANWVDISGNLPNVPVNVLVIDPANPNRVFAGTDVGVFVTTEGDQNSPAWVTLVNGLPRVAVLGLALHGPSRTLRAATHGRGMWDLLVPISSSFVVNSLSPSSAFAGSDAFTLSVMGTGFTPSSEVRWNGASRTTTFVSGNQLDAAISQVDVAAPGTFPVTVVDPGAGTSNARSFVVNPVAPPNDNFGQATHITASPFSNTVDTTNATNEAGDPVPDTPCVSGIGGAGRTRTIWYRFTPKTSGTVTIDTLGSSFDTVLTLWTGPALGSLSEVACNDDSNPNLTSQITNVAVNAGTTYHVMVGGYASTNFGSTTVNFTSTVLLNLAPIGFVDGATDAADGDGSIPQGGTLHISGWAADPESGAPVTRVEVFLNGASLGNAVLGSARPDVATGFSRSDFANSGWTLDFQLASVVPGSKTITAVAYDSLGASAPLSGSPSVAVTPNSGPIGITDLARDNADGDSSIVQGGTLLVSGWAADPESGAPVGRVEIRADGFPLGNATLGLSRPDVASGFGRSDFTNSGWTFTLPNLSLPPGTHTITAVGFDIQGASNALGGSLPINVVASAAPFGFVDIAFDSFDGDGSVAQGGSFQANGWAADPDSGAPVARVEVRVDGAAVGNAILGSARPDVATGFGRSDFTNSGWSFVGSVAGLSVGVHTISAVGFDIFNNSAALGTPRQINVFSNALPIGFVDSARDQLDGDANLPQGATLVVTGWAADPEAGSPVHSVEVAIDGVPVGFATLGGARPDVASGFGRSDFANSGWTLTLPGVNLALGSHIVTAVAQDSAGGSVQLGTPRSINVIQNQLPFGFVDAAFATADGNSTIPNGGSLTVTGWAADNETGTPIQKVEIRIDGNLVGNATLGGSRPDISSGFGRPDFANAGWTFVLPSISLSPGTHIVSAVAFDAYGGSAALNTPRTITVN